jgi:hypothetical protein
MYIYAILFFEISNQQNQTPMYHDFEEREREREKVRLLKPP